jgi:hypothetical protein
MHDFYAGNRAARRLKGLEAQHRPHLAFHRAMILLDDIIEIFAVFLKNHTVRSILRSP